MRGDIGNPTTDPLVNFPPFLSNLETNRHHRAYGIEPDPNRLVATGGIYRDNGHMFILPPTRAEAKRRPNAVQEKGAGLFSYSVF